MENELDGSKQADAAPEAQSLFADEEPANADPSEFDKQPPACIPIGPTPSFELVPDFFEMLQDMRGKRTAGGAKGSVEKKRALVQQMFVVRQSGRDRAILTKYSACFRDGGVKSEKTCILSSG